jgi:hypothetical protein
MSFGTLKGTLTGNGASVTASNALAGSVVVNTGDLIFAVFGQQTALTASAASDNLGNTYTAQNAGTLSGVSGRAFYARVTVPGTLTSVTVAASASTNDYAGFVAVIEGPFVAAPIDANPANTTGDITSPYACPATGTLAQALEVVIAWSASDGSATWSATSPNLLAGQAINATTIKVVVGYQAVNSTTTVSPAFTGTAPTGNVLGTASFKEDLSPPPPLGEQLGNSPMRGWNFPPARPQTWITPPITAAANELPARAVEFGFLPGGRQPQTFFSLGPPPPAVLVANIVETGLAADAVSQTSISTEVPVTISEWGFFPRPKPAPQFWTAQPPPPAVLSANLAEAASAAETVSETTASAATITETAAAADTLASTAIAGATISEAATAADTVSETTTSAAILAEAAAAADALSVAAAASVSLAEATSASDAVSGFVGVIVAEPAAAADTLSQATTAAASLSEAAAAADTLNASTAAGVGPERPVSITEWGFRPRLDPFTSEFITGGIAETTAQLPVFLVEPAAAFDTCDATVIRIATRAPYYARRWTPQYPLGFITGGIPAAVAAFSANLSEAASASDTVSQATSATANLTETGTATDLITAAVGAFAVTIAEPAAAADTLSEATTAATTLSESASAADALSETTTAAASLSEAGLASEQVAVASFAAAIVETAAGADTVSVATSATANLGEAVAATDLISANALFAATISEAAAASETVDGFTSTATFTADLSEAASATDFCSAQIITVSAEVWGHSNWPFGTGSPHRHDYYRYRLEGLALRYRRLRKKQKKLSLRTRKAILALIDADAALSTLPPAASVAWHWLAAVPKDAERAGELLDRALVEAEDTPRAEVARAPGSPPLQVPAQRPGEPLAPFPRAEPLPEVFPAAKRKRERQAREAREEEERQLVLAAQIRQEEEALIEAIIEHERETVRVVLDELAKTLDELTKETGEDRGR